MPLGDSDFGDLGDDFFTSLLDVCRLATFMLSVSLSNRSLSSSLSLFPGSSTVVLFTLNLLSIHSDSASFADWSSSSYTVVGCLYRYLIEFLKC